MYACGGLGSGLAKVDGECIGVAYDYAFSTSNDDILAKIKNENDAIGSDPSVTVAVLGSFTFDDSSPETAEGMRRVLIGAYTAARRFNEGKNADSIRMKIAVANEGSHQLQWRRPVEQLISLKKSDSPLIAVTGLGVSLNQTQDAAELLAANGIPMVAAIATADQLTAIDGFFRVSPPNREYVASLRNYVDEEEGLESAVLFADETPSEDDLFTSNLAEDLKDSFARELGNRAPFTFFGSADPGGGTPTMFGRKAALFCRTKVKMVLYAGRSNDLSKLLSALVDQCSGRPVTILTAGSDDIEGKIGGMTQRLQGARITVAYASGTDPRAWLNNRGAPDGFASFIDAYHNDHFADADLCDGEAMLAHDSVLAVATAIEAVLEEPGQPVTSMNIRGALMNLNGADLVRGATGDFAFASRDAQSGDPMNKPIPVITLPESAKTSHPPVYITPTS